MAYGDTMAACLGVDAAQQSDACQQSVDAAYSVSVECGSTTEGYYQCVADLTCDEVSGTGLTDCMAMWDTTTACG